MNLGQYLDIFIEESKEHLQHLSENLLELEKSPNNMATLNEIFRVAHTLKGIAGTMGFTKMTALTHDMENVLQTIRNGEISVTSNLVDVLFKCLDALETYVNEIVTTGSEGDNNYQDIIDELNNINDSKTNSKTTKSDNISSKDIGDDNSLSAVLFDENEKKPIENQSKKVDNSNTHKYKVTIKLSSTCLLKSARAFIVFQTLEKCGEVINASPSIDEIEEERFDNQFTVSIATNESQEKIINDVMKIAEIEEVSVAVGEIVETKTKQVQNEPISKVEDKSVSDKFEHKEKELPPKDKPNESQQSSKARVAKTVRVDINRLDNLMNLVSELIIIKTTLEDNAASEKFDDYKESIEYLERITTNLHDAVMKVRMVPVENVFNRFPRMIRDLSKELDKEIILNLSGEETEVDRTVIDELGDPLIHLLRNSADHGIEQPSIRESLGKPKAGTISLKAYHDGNNVVIEVEDDGAGINTAKIKSKVVEKGLASKEEVEAMEKSEIIAFLFKPSFSTTDKITDVSGRGVGLDVVRTKIEALGGEILVESELDKGSRFIIRLPLTLAIIQALLVIIGEEKYAIPLNSIKEILNITEEDIKTVQGQEVYMLRNQVIPVVRLDKKLDISARDTLEGKELTIVIIKKGEKLSGFLVDDLMGQQEIVIKSLGKYLRGIKSIAGATILGDGQVALILDVNSLA